jgi:hypothetical protein
MRCVLWHRSCVFKVVPQPSSFKQRLVLGIGCCLPRSLAVATNEALLAAPLYEWGMKPEETADKWSRPKCGLLRQQEVNVSLRVCVCMCVGLYTCMSRCECWCELYFGRWLGLMLTVSTMPVPNSLRTICPGSIGSYSEKRDYRWVDVFLLSKCTRAQRTHQAYNTEDWLHGAQ